MIINLMSFFALIPIWFSISAFYASNPKQSLLQQPISKTIAYLLSSGLLGLGLVIFSLSFDWVSAILATVIVTMACGVAVTLICGYSKKRYAVASSLLITTALLLGGLQHVA